MANFNDMDELELPSLDGLDYSDAPNAYEEPETYEEQADNEPVVDELDYSLDDISAPVFSEMDGSASPVPEKKTEPASQQKSVSLSKPSAPTPAFEEMGGGAAQSRAQTSASSGSYSSAGTRSSSNTYSGTSSSSGYQSVSGAPSYADSYSQTSQSSSYSNAFDAAEQERMEMYAKGRTRAKIVGIIAIVLDVLETLLVLSIRNIAVTALRIYFITKFMKGSSSNRQYTGFISILRIVTGIITIAQVDSLNSLAAEYGASFIITITQLILFLGVFLNCAVVYFTLFDKCVKQYTVDA